MRFRICALVMLLALCVSESGLAQDVSSEDKIAPVYMGPTLRVDGAHIPAIPGVPFYAKAEVETTQTLGNGSTVAYRTYDLIARDFRGRTHNEMRAWIPADNSDPKVTYVVLYDPETRMKTFIYPSSRMARQFLAKTSVMLAAEQNGALAPRIEKEDLGIAVEEGLELQGTRETRTYPTGSIGNDQPLAITTEYWYSQDLHLNLSVKRSDPRSGVQTVRLSNLHREEPNASLFEVPADYPLANEDGDTGGHRSSDAKLPPAKRLTVGETVLAAKLVTRVQPQYPDEAKKYGIQGIVKLHAVLDRDGSVQQVRIVSGYPALANAAAEAVRQWHYRPTLLNGEPVEVETAIEVIFMLKTQIATKPSH